MHCWQADAPLGHKSPDFTSCAGCTPVLFFPPTVPMCISQFSHCVKLTVGMSNSLRNAAAGEKVLHCNGIKHPLLKYVSLIDQRSVMGDCVFWPTTIPFQGRSEQTTQMSSSIIKKYQTMGSALLLCDDFMQTSSAEGDCGVLLRVKWKQPSSVETGLM